MYRECLRSFQELGDRRCTASTLKNLGRVALRLGRGEEAGGLLVAAIAGARAALGDELFASAWDRGRAIEREPLAARAAGLLDELTPTEA